MNADSINANKKINNKLIKMKNQTLQNNISELNILRKLTLRFFFKPIENQEHDNYNGKIKKIL